METESIVITVIGGFLAGCINTLAGNGSAITLSILTEVIGLPGNIANATNRVGIFMQGLASNYSFVKNKKLDVSTSKWPIIVSVIGALAGAWVAMTISNEHFKEVFKYLLVMMLLVVLIRPERWLNTPAKPKSISPFLFVPMYLAIGFYGGFIQMGMGLIFLAITVLVLRYNIIAANALKTIIVLVYTGIVLLIFHLNGLVDWKVGLILASGQALGGYITAEFASNYRQADKWAYYVLLMVMIWAIASTFNLL